MHNSWNKKNRWDYYNIKIALDKISTDNKFLKDSILKLADANEMQTEFCDENIFHVSQSTFDYKHIVNALSSFLAFGKYFESPI